MDGTDIQIFLLEFTVKPDLSIGFPLHRVKQKSRCLLTFNIDKSQRFDGSHAVLSHTGIRARVVFTHTFNNQLTVAINMIILNCGKNIQY